MKDTHNSYVFMKRNIVFYFIFCSYKTDTAGVSLYDWKVILILFAGRLLL